MTLRRLVTIVEIDADATECGACVYRKRGHWSAEYCGWYDVHMDTPARLPQCLAAEQVRVPLPIGPPVQFNAHGAFDEMEVEPPLAKPIKCARCGDTTACLFAYCTHRCTGECMQLCKRCKIEMMPLPARDQ